MLAFISEYPLATILVVVAALVAYWFAVLLRVTIAEIGYGATVSFNGTQIKQSVDFTAPEMELPEVKITNNQSPSATQEYLPGLVEPGTVTVNFIYNTGDFTTLFNAITQRTMANVVYGAPDGSSFTCNSFVKSLKKAGPMEGAETYDAVFKLSGVPTYIGPQ